MKYSEKNEEFEVESSWISISSLKKAAKISTIIENFQNEYTSPFNISAISDWKKGEKLNESVSYNNLHFSQAKKPAKPKMINLLKKVEKLNEEIVILSQHLKCSNKEIERLNGELSKIEKESAIKIQFMQEQHEKRLQKSKSDLDFLLKDMNSKSAAMIAQSFLQKHSEEIESIKQFYEKQLDLLHSQHESELILKDMEQEKYLNVLKI